MSPPTFEGEQMPVTRDVIDPEIWAGSRRARLLMALFGGGSYRAAARFSQRMLRPLVGRNVPGLDCSTAWIDRPDGSRLRVRIYRPPGQRHELPGVLWMHGGGYSSGVPEMNGARFKEFIDLRAAVIVSPDYRLSIEAPYPAALDDCYATLRWMTETAADQRILGDGVIIGGESAGGGLTAALSLLARDRGEVSVWFQLPLYPMIDDRETGSSRDNHAPVWNTASNRSAWELYLGPLVGTDDVPAYAAPARATDYRGLPPTFTFVGDVEPFRDETVSYVEHLREAGIPVEFEVYPGAFHAFDGMAPRAEISKEAIRRLLAAYARAVDSRTASSR
jgi:acetyl esterase/lipase